MDDDPEYSLEALYDALVPLCQAAGIVVTKHDSSDGVYYRVTQ